jgi:chemotaxis protein methyltransferase CheR
MTPISDTEFAKFQQFIFEAAGITLAAEKKALVMGRLGKRLAQYQMESFGDYFRLLASDRNGAEVQIAVDLLTTNETYFFREIKHFEFLREQALASRSRGQPYRAWSAASSSGEEAYSMAMVLADCMAGVPWEVLGTDISTKVLQQASQAVYRLERASHIPQAYLRRYCLRGTGDYAGSLLIDRQLRARVRFLHLNLNAGMPDIGKFDVIFLRNVMIYFNLETKREVAARVLTALKPGGYFCVGHSESLNDVTQAVTPVAPSIYHKPGQELARV